MSWSAVHLVIQPNAAEVMEIVFFRHPLAAA
jgi:hypothetical protein